MREYRFMMICPSDFLAAAEVEKALFATDEDEERSMLVKELSGTGWRMP